MPEKKDDPRQVLAVLNSMGFVGITAKQLQGFMKDLKLFRKMEEREKQLWKERVKNKIITKQCESTMLAMCDSSQSEPSPDDSEVKIEIRCVPETNKIRDNHKIIKTPQRTRSQSPRRRLQQNTPKINDDKPPQRPTEIEKQVSKEPAKISVPPIRVRSEPEIRNDVRPLSPSRDTASEPTARLPSSRNPSRCSSRSQPKSFIRPWKLLPEVQRLSHSVKSDPVALYQKYQKEWNQISFPGENRHADVRWAVREKMLGTDPTPRPTLKKSCSTMSVRRK